jgi:hypothetical protein
VTRSGAENTGLTRKGLLSSAAGAAAGLLVTRYKRTVEQQRQFERLKRKLARVERTRLRPLS